jgi:hypothetical protein
MHVTLKVLVINPAVTRNFPEESRVRPGFQLHGGMLKGVLILQRKFAMVSTSEPIYSPYNSQRSVRQYSTPAVLCRGKAPTRCFGRGRGSVGQMLNEKKQPSCLYLVDS